MVAYAFECCIDVVRVEEDFLVRVGDAEVLDAFPVALLGSLEVDVGAAVGFTF